jgi:hypothetical protein
MEQSIGTGQTRRDLSNTGRSPFAKAEQFPNLPQRPLATLPG